MCIEKYDTIFMRKIILVGKTVTDGKLSERPSLQEKLVAMKAKVSGTPAGRDVADKAKKKEEIL